MVNQEDAAHGFRLIREFEGISLGLHCNIVLGKPVTDPALIPSLVDKTYAFRSSRYYRAAVTDQVNYEEACMEIQNQIAAFRKLTGRLPDYVDYHAACTPTFLQAVEAVCRKQELVYIPYPEGRVGEYEIQCCELSSQDPFDVNPAVFYERNKDTILGKKLPIAVFHPGYVDARIMQVSSLNLQRAVDLEFVTRKESRRWLKEHNVEIVNFEILKKEIQEEK